MRQTGKVIETKGKKAVVRFVRSDACGHCNACFRLGSNEADIDIDNALNAQIGDLVGIEMHAKSVLKASLILYGVPLVARLWVRLSVPCRAICTRRSAGYCLQQVRSLSCVRWSRSSPA